MLEQNLELLGAYVLHVAKGDQAIVDSSGFVPSRPRVRTNPQSLPQPSINSIEQGNSGQLLVWITRVAKARAYDVQYAPVSNGTPASWTEVTVTAAQKPVSITGLTPGITYAFQVRALGPLGYTDWSDSATRMSI